VHSNHHVHQPAGHDDDFFDRVAGDEFLHLLVRDRGKIEELWKPEFKMWFPEGKDDPEVALEQFRKTVKSGIRIPGQARNDESLDRSSRLFFC